MLKFQFQSWNKRLQLDVSDSRTGLVQWGHHESTGALRFISTTGIQFSLSFPKPPLSPSPLAFSTLPLPFSTPPLQYRREAAGPPLQCDLIIRFNTCNISQPFQTSFQNSQKNVMISRVLDLFYFVKDPFRILGSVQKNMDPDPD